MHIGSLKRFVIYHPDLSYLASRVPAFLATEVRLNTTQHFEILVNVIRLRILSHISCDLNLLDQFDPTLSLLCS